ncbi:DedA family protein [Moorella sulfitireducens]|uniref:DedA family protein n=1 Tax=Neomoorella sulfitireducens TaxID=2972948 RepID=UPI0021AC9919|nr:DedA family protein [Moorella sulfitireducens]
MTAVNVYLALFGLLFMIGTGMPGIPFQPVYLAAGYLIERGEMSFWGAVMVGTAGNLLGNLIGYWLGSSPGRGIIERFFRQGWGPDGLEKTRKWLERYGVATVFLAHWFGPIRTPAILAAGIFRMNPGIYAFYSALGAFSWTLAWQYASWKGAHYFLGWWYFYRQFATWWLDALLILAMLAATAGFIYYCRYWYRK